MQPLDDALTQNAEALRNWVDRLQAQLNENTVKRCLR